MITKKQIQFLAACLLIGIGFYLYKKQENTDHSFLVWHWAKTAVKVMCASSQIDQFNKPIVTVFGGHRVEKDDIIYKKAFTIAQQLAQHDFIILSGAGSGIMQAVDCGSRASGKSEIVNIGLSVSGLETNTCTQLFIRLSDFFARKWLMIRKADIFLVFPGGVGTVDEAMEVLTLIDTEKEKQRKLIFVDQEYWKPLKTWLFDNAVKRDLVNPQVLKSVLFLDSVEEVVDTVVHAL